MMSGYPRVFLLMCVTLNIVSIRSTDRTARNFSPNFEAEYPHFTPFNNQEYVQMSSDLRTSDDSTEQPILSPKVSHHQVPPRPKDDFHFESVHPLKSFVMDLYQNYRSAYLNQTLGSMLGVTPDQIEEVIGDNTVEEAAADPEVVVSTKKEKRRKNKLKRKNNVNSIAGGVDELKYNVGPGVNISMDTSRELVNVYLDEDCLKDVFSGKIYIKDNINKIYKNKFIFFRSRPQKRSHLENPAAIHFALSHPIGRRPIRGDHSQAVARQIHNCRQNCHLSADHLRSEEPRKVQRRL